MNGKPAEMPSIYGSGAIYAWPGYGEAYGLAYLEAQAAGLPVVAQDIDGVPGVVRDGETGMLTPAGDTGAFADAIATLLGDASLRRSMSQAARRFVFEERSFDVASARLASILESIGEGPQWLTNRPGNRFARSSIAGGNPAAPSRSLAARRRRRASRPPRSIACSI